ncbi:MAG: M3 family metallopeptidase [Pirellulaceae bacterium]|jgi:peptidyl-dipeptidase Dcp|nr:M3 family metallopeptidase [Pirellulaceae bacterium]
MFRRVFICAAIAILAIGFAGARVAGQENSAGSKRAAKGARTVSAILNEWTGPHGGVPPWNLVRPEEFEASFETAIAAADKDIDAIANSDQPPTFENTIVAIESAGRTLDRVQTLFGVHSGNLNLGPIPDIERVVSPKLSEHRDRISQNKKLFARIEAIYRGDELAGLNAAERRLVEDRYHSFVRTGARLDDDDQAKLAQINKRLASLFTDFRQNVLADEESYVTWIEDEKQLSGLPKSVIEGMAGAAAERGKVGQWAITNTRSSMDPFLTYSDVRPLREKVWRTYYNRGDNGDERDNNAIISEILRLRAGRAKLLGYQTHAHWRVERQMAKTPEAAMVLLLSAWPKAVAKVREEVADMQAEADRAGDEITIEPWDYRYYAEKVRKQKYDLDFNEVKPYLQLDKLSAAMMWAAGELFGYQFEQVDDLPVFHPDVTVWEVKDRQGAHVGLFYLDPFARRGKQSGAWMTDYRAQEGFEKSVTPIVSNNSNFVKGVAGEPVLISWDDAVTLFHEFGHALHGLSSQVKYPSQAGTSVARDYVEFPSQIYEHWLSTPTVLNRFALHYQTGDPMPPELLAKIKKASTFNEGFATVEYLASALIDMRLHLAGDVEINPDSFERETLAELGMPKEIVMRHRTPQFAHIFAGDGYSAGYYSYFWADALTADAAEAFEQSPGGYYDAATAQSLYDNVLSVGDTVDPAEAFRTFRGRDVDTGALLRKRGFAD